MEKQKRQTLNADKRKVIADIFQQHFEDNSKYKKQHSEAIETYNDMRSVAKVKNGNSCKISSTSRRCRYNSFYD